MKKNLIIIILALIILAVAGFFALKILKNPAANNNESDIGGSEAELVYKEDKSIAASGIGIRPDSRLIGGNIFVNIQHTPLKSGSRLLLLKLDQNLNLLSTTDAYSGTKLSTDARMSIGENNNLWYAFESTDFPVGKSNYLNLAEYDIGGSSPKLIAFKADVAAGGYVTPEKIPADGTELSEDPAPFYLNEKYYVLTEKFNTPKFHVRVFSYGFKFLEEFDLDLSPALSGTPSVSSIIKAGNDILLMTADRSGPPVQQGSASHLVAIPLNNDLKSVKGSKIMLSQSDEYDDYAVAVRYEQGKLYVINEVNQRSDALNINNGYSRLRVFDKENEYKLVSSIKINNPIGASNVHKSLEIVGNKIYVFYHTKDEQIRAKIFKWQAGKSFTNTDNNDDVSSESSSQIPSGETQPVQGKCGDGKCDDFEKSSGKCPGDCK